MTRRQALALGSPPLAGLVFFAAAFLVGKVQDQATSYQNNGDGD